jgi:hypothetical protein
LTIRRCWNGVVRLRAEFKKGGLGADAADGADAGATAELQNSQTAELQTDDPQTAKLEELQSWKLANGELPNHFRHYRDSPARRVSRHAPPKTQ